MKINRLDAHERLEHFKRDQEANIFQGVDDCLKRNPICLSMQEYFPWVYIFGHPRTADDGVNKRMLWQPRLLKPKAQTNSYLFRALSKTDLVEIIWLLPPREIWSQYEKGKVTESEDVITSIKNFVNHKDLLEAPHNDDYPEEKIRKILEAIQQKHKKWEMI
jgi:hypothetical protein